jgi:NAD(P)-dependent dehydrogenase (short-subunit alcohol dehydrogenase family)
MTIDGRLNGKVALITGGASGIGAATARLYAKAGAKIAIADINDNLGRGLADDIGDALYLHLDTTDEAEWRSVVARTLDRFGTLNVLVNAAGISGRISGTGATPKIEDQDLENWNTVMNVNSTGIFLGMKHVIGAMRAANGGSIINISSIYGIVGSPHNVAYHASKGSVRLSTKAAALQYAAENIRVNSVHPGFVTSPMTQFMHDDPQLSGPRLAQTPLGRFGTPDDIANGCLFLASDESGWMTGAELVIDGGMTAG